jgi:hypothetical protein
VAVEVVARSVVSHATGGIRLQRVSADVAGVDELRAAGLPAERIDDVDANALGGNFDPELYAAGARRDDMI